MIAIHPHPFSGENTPPSNKDGVIHDEAIVELFPDGATVRSVSRENHEAIDEIMSLPLPKDEGGNNAVRPHGIEELEPRSV